MKYVYPLLILLFPTINFAQDIYKIEYFVKSNVEGISINENEFTIQFVNGDVIFGGPSQMFNNDGTLNKFIRQNDNYEEKEIYIDSLDVPDELKELLLESNNMNQKIIRRNNYINTKSTYNRFLIKNDTIFESRFGLEADQKIVYEKPTFKWSISDSTKIVGEYKTYLATMSYYGRDYRAWFCNDIPIFHGPYIFGGLPGLILELEDTNQYFQIRLKSMEKVTDMPIENLSIVSKTITLLEGIKLQHKAIDNILMPLKLYDRDNLIATTGEFDDLREVILEKIDNY